MRLPTRRGLAAVLLLPAAGGALALGGCGGGGSGGDAQRLLGQAFTREVGSADLKIDAQIKARGPQALKRPLRIHASGPYRRNKGKLPSLDIGLNLGTAGGQTVQTGVLSTGDRSFVKFQDVYYEQPRSQVARTNSQLARGGRRAGSLKSLGLDPRSWIKDPKQEGGQSVGGVETTHVSGKLDVRSVLRDLNDFVKRSGSTIGSATGQTPRPLSDSDIKKVSEVVKDPHFDVYVGKSDQIIRRVAGSVEFDVPEADRASLGGLEGGSIDFSVELSNVNGNQRIVAPARARPLSELTNSLGAGTLGGVGGGTAPQAGGGTTAPGSPSADQFKQYSKCLDRAKSQDTRALQRCARLLR